MQHAEFFRILSDPTRLRTLYLLSEEQELCVCELVAALGLAQPKISRHLAALRDAGVVASRRDAQWVFHKISPDLPKWQRAVLKNTFESLADSADTKRDSRRLKAMKNRPDRARAA